MCLVWIWDWGSASMTFLYLVQLKKDLVVDSPTTLTVCLSVRLLSGRIYICILGEG